MKSCVLGGFAEEERKRFGLGKREGSESDLIESGIGNIREFKWAHLMMWLSSNLCLAVLKYQDTKIPLK